MSEGGLQFDRAEPAKGGSGTAAACTVCKQPLGSVYYEVNGKVICERCRNQVLEHMHAGSSAGRFGKALLFGIGAAIAGTVLYYAILAITGLELSLISIVVGFMVGAAVRKGSGGRGGWRYQALAMFLTYTSIVSSYVPIIVQEIRNQRQTTAATTDSTVAAPTTQKAAADSVPALSSGAKVVAIITLLGILYALPFLGGADNIIGIIIIAIGVYEAWRLNRKVELSITGPFKVAPA